MLTPLVLRMLPFLSRWLEVAPAACCGVCPACIGTAAGGLLIPTVLTRRDRQEEDE